MIRLTVAAVVLSNVPKACAEYGLARTYLLDDEPGDGARCLDGTPVRFWLQEASGVNKTKWSIHLMGGGNCESLDDCADRGYNPLACYMGSSSAECYNSNVDAQVALTDEMRFEDIASCNGGRWCGGLMSGDRLRNPLTHDWNKVLVQYCDGGMWLGNNATVSYGAYSGKLRPLYFRGMRNAMGVLTRLLQDHGLAHGTDLVLSGDSSGGIGTLWLADRIKERLSLYGIRVVAAPDHGYFPEEEYLLKHGYDWRAVLRWTYNAMNGTVDQGCMDDAVASGRDPAEFCTLPETSTSYIDTPLFLVNSRYDPAWESGAGIPSSETNHMGDKLLRLIKDTALDRPCNAAFITSCDEHCGQWSQQNNDYQVYVDGDSAATAVNAWYGGFTTQSLWLQPDAYPCKSCCNMKPAESFVVA